MLIHDGAACLVAPDNSKLELPPFVYNILVKVVENLQEGKAVALLPLMEEILPALVEWRRSGVFEWSSEHNTPMASDSFVAWAGIIAGILVLVFYFPGLF